MGLDDYRIPMTPDSMRLKHIGHILEHGTKRVIHQQGVFLMQKKTRLLRLLFPVGG